ncbi:HEAT repeat domain-containing protein [Brasilonema bromeliae]|uniref:Calcineurin-like phosphoesterase domain-containing protein n=1 Tax=Brasilonema bromeliae SPC951 TaxID=385972 RepID=A0ABX1PCM5_9CYAN|nr:hypothetical protein [Brasilonema bromeliae SPC951]
MRRRAAQALEKIGDSTAVTGLIQALNDEDSDVRRRVVGALVKIGDSTAVTGLIQALNDEDSDVRRSAAQALRNITSPEKLPELTHFLLTTTETHLLNIISNIQDRCKFYNYTLTQPPRPQPTPTSISMTYILHLSDLHFGTLENADLWCSQLADDLKIELDRSRLDVLILSGDIANKSTSEEYDAAKEFLDKLCQEFQLKQEQIVIVPGNHDLNWQFSEDAYTPHRRKNYQGQLKPGRDIDGGDYIEVRDEEKYKQRFAHFSKFYESIKHQPYPLEYDEQGILHHFKEQNILVLGLNSAWELDHHYKSRPSINSSALSKALNSIRQNQEYQNCLKIAVWHHPLDSPYEDPPGSPDAYGGKPSCSTGLTVSKKAIFYNV